jgi:hypothetical protein
MTIKSKVTNGLPEGRICEQFAYLPDLAAYPNSSDMNKLDEKCNL